MKAEDIKVGKTYVGGKLGRTRTVEMLDHRLVWYRSPSNCGYSAIKLRRGVFAAWAQSEVPDTPAEEERAG